MAPAPVPDLSLTEWAVLALVAEKPTHGFAAAKELAVDGDLGRIWTVGRPLVYRALATLTELRLIEPVRVESGNRGPSRTRLRVTRAGKTAVQRWLNEPVPHVRDLRSRLLLQLRLLDRRHLDGRLLVAAQLEQLLPTITALQHQTTVTSGFDRLLASWRYESARAAALVLEGLIAEDPDGVGPTTSAAKVPEAGA